MERPTPKPGKDTRFRAGVCFVLLLCLASMVSVARGAERESPATLELHGRVLVPAQARRPGRRITLSLVQVGTPFSAQTRTDSKGRFRFRKLQPGTYSLGILIPGTGEILQTVEVSPSFADARGRVEKQFLFNQETLQQQARLNPQGLVSVRELSIPRKARSEYRKARDSLRKRDLEDAVRRLEKAVELAPQFMEALNNLGMIYFQQREYAKAESYFRKALDLEPEAFEPLVNLGGTLLALGRVEEAIEVCGRAQSARPKDALANAQLGLGYFLAGDDESALNYLLLTQELDPAHFTNPQIPLARIYLRHSEEEAALEELEDFLRIRPDSPEADSVRATVQRIEQALQAETAGNPSSQAR
jgi:tetratricopeptide (TPR) repeat protein